MLANNIKLMSKEIAPACSADDVAKIKKFCKAQTKDIFDHLSKSLAPNVHDHEYIKKAILCMLLRDNEKVLNNGTRIKGDINILLLEGNLHTYWKYRNNASSTPLYYGILTTSVQMGSQQLLVKSTCPAPALPCCVSKYSTCRATEIQRSCIMALNDMLMDLLRFGIQRTVY